MKKLNFLKSTLLALFVLIGSVAWAAPGDLIYNLDLAAQNSAFGTSNSYSAKDGTVDGVTWYANAASAQSAQNVWLGANNANNRTNLTKLSLGLNGRGSAIATALGVNDSDIGYYAIVAANSINNVGSIKVKASATAGTAPSTLWCLYTTDGGATYTILEQKSSPGTTEQIFTPDETIASAEYAFALYSTKEGTYRTPYFKFYEGETDGPVTPRVDIPVISPEGGDFEDPFNVTITTDTEGATIYYTLDETTPDATSTEYTAPFEISETTTVKAIAVKEGMDDSFIATQTYTYVEPIEPPAGDFLEDFESETVLTNSYNTNSFTNPDTGITWTYNNARNEGDYPIVDKGITFQGNAGYLEATFSNGVGTFAFQARKAFTGGSNNREFSLIVNGNIIGTTPKFGEASTDATIHNFSFDVEQGGSVTVRIQNNGPQVTIDNIAWTEFESDTERVETPVITPATGTYEEAAQTVSITTETEGATIYYTTDGTVPTEESTEYEGEFLVEETTTIKAIAVKEGMDDSEVAEVTITIEISETCLDTPVAIDATISGTGFTANWNEVAGAEEYEITVYTDPIKLFSENFDEQTGTGGNDGLWSGSVAGSAVSSGLEDWTLERAYAADGAIKLGTASAQGYATTPALGLDGDATLSFRAGAWSTTSESTTLLLEISGGGTLSVASVELVKVEFNNYSVEIVGGTANTKVTFKGQKANNSRFFLDDVEVSVVDEALTGSPFTTSDLSYEFTNSTHGVKSHTSYYYTVVAKLNDCVSSASNEIEAQVGPITGLSSTESNLQIWSSGNTVFFNATAGEAVELYNLAGQKMQTYIANDGVNSLTVNTTGVVIVKAGDRVSKVIVK